MIQKWPVYHSCASCTGKKRGVINPKTNRPSQTTPTVQPSPALPNIAGVQWRQAKQQHRSKRSGWRWGRIWAVAWNWGFWFVFVKGSCFWGYSGFGAGFLGIPSGKLTWLAGKSTMKEDVFPIEKGDFPMSCWFSGVDLHFHDIHGSPVFFGVTVSPIGVLPYFRISVGPCNFMTVQNSRGFKTAFLLM